MTLQDYQERAMQTCMQSSNNFTYMMLNLVGEVGEFASKVAKYIRKEKAVVNENELEYACKPISKGEINELANNKEKIREYTEHNAAVMQSDMEELKKEAGDILWQLSGLCSVMGWQLEDVAQQNLDKLASRKDRGVIDGSGDNR